MLASPEPTAETIWERVCEWHATTGEKDLAALNEKLRLVYQAGKPFREGAE